MSTYLLCIAVALVASASNVRLQNDVFSPGSFIILFLAFVGFATIVRFVADRLSTPPDSIRLPVTVCRTGAVILQRVAAEVGNITLDELFRRMLVLYDRLLSAQLDGGSVIIRTREGTEKQIVL